MESESEVGQSCPTLLDPMDCSLPGFSAHGIFRARVLEWGATAFSVFVLSAVRVVLDSFSHNLSAPLSPRLPAHQSQDTRVFVSVSALLSAFLYTRWWVLSCWPTQEHDDLHFGAII